jgi:ABC-type transport system involved in multi-copper enzyme maturation permease subunit
MRFLPIVERELRVGARRRSTYSLRLLAALAAFIICLWLCLLPARGQPPTALGKSLFGALSTAAIAYCLLIGPFITADCLSSEKRDGTLGLLFLTDLSSLDVVLGKWVATSLSAFYGLLAVLPSLGIPLLLGGVTPGEYGRVALAIVNAVLFSLTAGIFVSVLSRDQTKATLGSLILVLTLSGLLPGLIALVVGGFLGLGPINPLTSPVTLFSPIYTLQFAFDATFNASPRQFWTSLGVVQALGWLFMIAATVTVSRVWKQEPIGPRYTARWRLRLGWTRGWQRLFKRRLERNPIYALASRHRWPHWVFWALVGIVAINIYWLTIGLRRHPNIYGFHQNFSLAMYFINRVWIAAMACRFFAEARRSGALELILTTPIKIGTILRGRRRAIFRLFFWPVLAIAVLHWCYLWGSWQPSANQPNSAVMFRMHAIMATGSLVSFLTDVLALTALGGWLSLASRKTHLVILKTFILVTLIPWLAFYLLSSSGWLMRVAPTTYLASWPIVMVTKNLLFLGWAIYKVRRHFRAAAADTYGLRRRRHKAALPHANQLRTSMFELPG